MDNGADGILFTWCDIFDLPLKVRSVQAQSLANQANRKIEQYNDAARKSSQHAQSHSDHIRTAREINRQGKRGQGKGDEFIFSG